jgi:hypothetical protein
MARVTLATRTATAGLADFGYTPSCCCADCRRGRQVILEALIDGELQEFEVTGNLAATTMPTPGRYYTIKRGDTLLGSNGITARAYRHLGDMTDPQERLKAARQINEAYYNRRFHDPKLTENGLFPQGRISFSPTFSCDLAAQQAASRKAPSGRCFATILVPTLDSNLRPPKAPESPRPRLPSVLPPPSPSPLPLPPRKPKLLPQARYRDPQQLRRHIRDDVWVLAEASSLLGGPGRNYEWFWTIYQVVEPGEPLRFGVTKFKVGDEASASRSSFLAVRERLGLKATDQRVQLVEHGHTHPINAQSRHETCGEDLSGVTRSEAVCRASNAGPSPCGDKALVLRFGEPEAVITPSGRYIRGVSLLKSPLRTLTRENRGNWKDSNVQVDTLLKGQSSIFMPQIDATELKKRLTSAIEQLKNEKVYSARAVAAARQKLNRWSVPKGRSISRSCRRLITRLERGKQ